MSGPASPIPPRLSRRGLTASPPELALEEPLMNGPDSEKSFKKAGGKPRTWFGHLPVRSEWVPLDSSGQVDWAHLTANIVAGGIIGMREALGGIVSASLLFSSLGELSEMFPFGISLVWYSTAFGTLWYVIFGRFQYAYPIAQDVVGILQASMAVSAAQQLEGTPSKIPATVLAIIALSSVLTGICSLIMGKLGLGKYMLLFPTPVTHGFLGAIGWVIMRTSLQTSSGVKFKYFYPESFETFCATKSLVQVSGQLVMVCFIRLGPMFLEKSFPKSDFVRKMGGLMCQLLPLAMFYTATALLGISMEELTEKGWTYPMQSSHGPLSLWTTYKREDIDIPTVLSTLPAMPSVVVMAVLCTMTGALALTDRFPTGPDGDPAPLEVLDFDRELATVGLGSVLLGLTGGTLTFHTFTSIQLRLDGGTHRIAVLAVAAFVGGAFLSGAPIGHYIPKWFLSGLFMNTAIHFLKGALLSYRLLPYTAIRCLGLKIPSPQYAITLVGILVAVFETPATAIACGLFLSVALFLFYSSMASPIINVAEGNRVVSRTKRPCWELRVLMQEGDRIVLLYLQGQLFFGSVRRLVAALEAAGAGHRAEYCILSFARVPDIDPSAARNLKTVIERLKVRGCRVICCRTNVKVFKALVAAGVVESPDDDLVKHLQGLRWRTVEDANTPMVRLQSLDLLTTSSSSTFRELDAFAHETDALDYCDDRIVETFCYGAMASGACDKLEPYMLAYREARFSGVRLPEWAFEDMNNLPRGFLDKLRPYCEVQEDVQQWSKLNASNCLVLILRGAISLVQLLPQAQEVSALGTEARGFSFRQGKRLRKRYGPGCAVGKVSFILAPKGQVVDEGLMPSMIVSSKLAPAAELWVLRPAQWDSLPDDVRQRMTVMLCAQLADDAQHSQLQEH